MGPDPSSPESSFPAKSPGDQSQEKRQSNLRMQFHFQKSHQGCGESVVEDVAKTQGCCKLIEPKLAIIQQGPPTGFSFYGSNTIHVEYDRRMHFIHCLLITWNAPSDTVWNVVCIHLDYSFKSRWDTGWNGGWNTGWNTIPNTILNAPQMRHNSFSNFLLSCCRGASSCARQ